MNPDLPIQAAQFQTATAPGSLAEVVPLLVIGALAGGFVNGLAGFGTALFALGFFLSVMPPLQAVAVVVVIAAVTGLQGLWIVRRAMRDNLPRLARFLLPAWAGIPVGLWFLSMVEPGGLKLLIAGFLLAYGGFFSLRRNLPRIDRPLRGIDVAVGFVGGVMGGAAAISGALPTMWCALRGWPKAETRAVLQPFNFAILATTATALALRGAYDRQTLTWLALALPAALLSAQIGIRVFRRIDDDGFRRLLIGLCFASGAVLALRELA